MPLGEKDGNLSFFSEKLQRYRAGARADCAAHSSMCSASSTMPCARSSTRCRRVSLHGTLAVTSGLKAQSGSAAASLRRRARAPFRPSWSSSMPATTTLQRTRLLDESRQPQRGEHHLPAWPHARRAADDLADEIYRCQRIVELHRNDPDQEVKDYCASQTRPGRPPVASKAPAATASAALPGLIRLPWPGHGGR